MAFIKILVDVRCIWVHVDTSFIMLMSHRLSHSQSVFLDSNEGPNR